MQIYKTYYPETVGGVETCIHQLSAGFAELGVDNWLATTTTSAQRAEHDWRELRVNYFPATFTLASTPVSLSFLKHFPQMAAEADLLHYHFPWPYADAVHLLRRPNKPYIITYHSDIVKQKWLDKMYRPLMQKFFAKAQAIVVTSDNLRRSSLALRDFLPQTTVIPLGLNANDYPEVDIEKLKQWRECVGSGFFLFVGVLRYYKALHVLIAAAAKTGLPVVIAGSGPEADKLKMQAKRLIATSVTFLGHVDDADKIALYHLARAVVIPSNQRSEAFCLSLVEGLMYAKPLISTELGTGTSFVNQHNETGFVIPPNDVAALAQAMTQLAADDKLCETMGAKAQQRYQQYFTADKMVKAYYDLYKRILSR